MTGYQVLVDGAEVTTVAGSVTGLNLTNLMAGTSYQVQIEAVDAAGNATTDGPTTALMTVAVVLADTTAPVWTGASVTATNITETTADLSWTVATDDTAVTGYRVLLDGTQVIEVADTVTSFSLTALTAGTSYAVAIQAVDAAGNASTSGPVATVMTI